MTEDQEFELLELRQRQEKYSKLLHQAHIEAERFVQARQGDLSIMTLRKAFELGFLAGAGRNK